MIKILRKPRERLHKKINHKVHQEVTQRTPRNYYD